MRIRVVHGSGRPAGRVGSGRVEIFRISCFLGFLAGFSGRVGSGQFLIGDRRVGSGRVGSGVRWVGSGLEKWNHGQL
jgi:hypothetical protein